MSLFARDVPELWDDGWSRVPHGLWTLDLPAGAKILLGWLHSHSNTFLAKVTMNHARRAVGSSSIKPWFDALETAGFVKVRTDGNGFASKITLLSAPWTALLGGRNLSTTDPKSDRCTAPKSDRYRAEIGSGTAPKSDRIEEQGEDQEELLGQLPLTGGDLNIEFERWWAVWPRKVAKIGAVKAYTRARRVASAEQLLAGATIVAAEAAAAPDRRQFIPHQATWLNDGRWLDHAEVGAAPIPTGPLWTTDPACDDCGGSGWKGVEGTLDVVPCECRRQT